MNKQNNGHGWNFDSKPLWVPMFQRNSKTLGAIGQAFVYKHKQVLATAKLVAHKQRVFTNIHDGDGPYFFWSPDLEHSKMDVETYFGVN